MKLILPTFSFLLYWSALFAQADTVYLMNPSFEGKPVEGEHLNTQLPKGWNDCGFREETPPDVHPVDGGAFAVTKPPSHGRTYIGMITRDNDTWERISGKLSSSLKKGHCYSFSIDLARSEYYMSFSRLNNTQANYVQPIKLRIYGGEDPCERAEMIGETSLIQNSRWLKYSFIFRPQEDYKFITFEAFYQVPTLAPYNGNLLMDNASFFLRIPCESASLEKIMKKEVFTSREEKEEYLLEQKIIEEGEEVTKKERAKNMADFNKLVALTKLAGKSIEFDNKTINFKPESFKVADIGYTAKSGLHELFKLVKANPKLSILIGVKKKDGKETQRKRIEKLEQLVKAAGLNEGTVLVRKKNKIKWSYPWDAENGDLVFYVFDPEN